MARVISIHEYDLKPGADVAAFEQAVRDAKRRGLFALAGLVSASPLLRHPSRYCVSKPKVLSAI
jgi:hypothetical protein